MFKITVLIIEGPDLVGKTTAIEKLGKHFQVGHSYFMREITIPDGVTIDDITSEYVYGILTIHIPKK